MTAVSITDNAARSRYETVADGMLAVLEYDLKDSEIVLRHTEVPLALEGRGIGSALTRHALADAKARGLTVVPTCPFVSSYLGRHHELLDNVRADYAEKIKAN
jgi:predicted GNAT family acetyltransferase